MFITNKKLLVLEMFLIKVKDIFYKMCVCVCVCVNSWSCWR